jgi:hypothetical protein
MSEWIKEQYEIAKERLKGIPQHKLEAMADFVERTSKASDDGVCRNHFPESRYIPTDIPDDGGAGQRELIRSLNKRIEVLEEALREVIAVFESEEDNGITDTVWVKGSRTETLYDCCRAALLGEGGENDS